jgi:predicted aspartyl protease
VSDDELDPWEPDWNGPPRTSGRSSPLTRRSPDVRPVASQRDRWKPSILLVTLSALPGALAAIALLGIGLRHGAPPWEASLTALLLIALPIVGLGSLFRHHKAVLLLAMWAWPIVALLAMPRWFPGERGAGLSEGFAWLALPLGESWSGRAASVGGRIGELMGGGDELVVATPIEPPVRPVRGAEAEHAGAGEAIADGELAPESTPEQPGRVVLPYEGDGRSMKVAVTFDGPDVSEELTLLFDTGATFTTMDRGARIKLGVPIPAGAPTATFQTANGQVDSPLVLLDRVWLGERAIQGVTVAVCDDCSSEGTVGLLGLNLSGQFHVTLDHELQEIVLEADEGGADRHLDITHWLDIEGTATRYPTGRVVVELAARNRAHEAISEAVVEVECPDRSFAAEIAAIPSQGERHTRFELPRGTNCDSYRVILRTARW